MSIACLGVSGLREEARHACEDGRIDPWDLNYGDFEEIWAEARADADVLAVLDRRGWRPFTDALADFETWYCFSDAYREEQRHG